MARAVTDSAVIEVTWWLGRAGSALSGHTLFPPDTGPRVSAVGPWAHPPNGRETQS
jgi:hypothetical protein